MNMDFADAMRAAMNLTRGRRLTEATRLIQNALAGRGRTADGEAIEPRVINLTNLTPNVAASEMAPPSLLELDTGSQGSRPPRSAEPRTAGPLAWVVGRLHGTELPGLRLDGLAGVKVRKALEIPDGAQFLSRSFTCAAGTRSYKLYVPRGHHGGQRKLLIMLHGGTQDADDFAAGTRMNALAEEHDFIIAYPSQSKAANASLCWNWFTPENQMRERGEPSIIAGITNEIIATYDIDPARVFVAGLSAGGAMAAVMGATYPDIYAAVGVHSGLPYRSATDVVSAFAAMRGDAGPRGRRSRKSRGTAESSTRIRTIVFHGDADRIVHPSNADKIVEAHAKMGGSVERTEARPSAGRRHTRAVTRDKTGSAVVEQWVIHGSGHAWSGGSPDGSYIDPHGPDASREMLRFFLDEAAARQER